ncbi:uncharacterized protein AKAW2_11894S [Aspergillus luchuensis]|uniref:Uncharacterized protein n=1 Tax=Aspergillus kawachii TaxID=1069201 RepID=A0A7R7ZU91_ASPKA|nr:uncharacterized protein AKAW2_11894S [Aspergillus luchuensis]BCR94848.1 hypothetical protein AKAW2_11894S [Aspergillus luchuensis]
MRGLDRKVSLNRGRIEVSGKAREKTSTFADDNAQNLSILSKVSSLSLFEIIPAGPIALLCILFRQEASDGFAMLFTVQSLLYNWVYRLHWPIRPLKIVTVFGSDCKRRATDPAETCIAAFHSNW